jgi:hypothetical protein
MGTTPPASDDEGLLDDVEEIVDDVLGENLPAPEPEDPWERRQRVLDTMTAVILAVAAVATAWATFQASQWSGAQSDAVAASSTARTESIRYASAAEQTEQLDTALWLQWLDAVSSKDTRRAVFLRERFRPTLAAAHAEWVAKAVVTPSGTITDVPPGTPFSEPKYRIPAQAKADALSAEAEEDLARSQEDAETSTNFVTNALVLALVLFFAGIATKFRSPKIQTLLVVLAIGFGAFGLIRLLTLPQLL